MTAQSNDLTPRAFVLLGCVALCSSDALRYVLRDPDTRFGAMDQAGINLSAFATSGGPVQ